jgi:peptidoglycan hydrolase-like protein with peptidoglycan-binding domain
MKKIIAIAGFIGIFTSQALLASAGYFNNSPVITCESHITRTLQVGSENNEVYTLQQILAQLGFLDANPNGYFGRQTKYAVQSFQMNNSISPTGVVGYQTREALNESACGGDVVSVNGGSNYTFNPYNYTSGMTQVSSVDPFVTVINPPVANPVVYATPQNIDYTATVTGNSSYVNHDPRGPVVTPTVVQLGSSNSSSQIASTQIIYSPSLGYTYGITPTSGSLTVSSPVANAVYNEGDTVFVNWGTNNLSTYSFNIVLESNISGQTKIVGSTSGNSYSFVLTKALLDSVCSGTCNNNQQGSFRVVVTTPSTDMAGNTSTLRAAIAPITIRRPLGNAQVTISGSKTPVNSGEIFKLYINVPTANQYGYATTDVYGAYSVRLRAICPSSVTASIAGVPCGQEFTVPPTVVNTQQEIPAVITNGTWYKQDVTFKVTVVNLSNQVIGEAETKVMVNATPFSF